MRLRVGIGALRIWDVTVTCCCSCSFSWRVRVDAMAARETTKTDSRLAARCAAVASLGAAVIHVAVAPMHWQGLVAVGGVLCGTRHLPTDLGLSRVVEARRLGPCGRDCDQRDRGHAVGHAHRPLSVPSAGQPEAVGAAGICVLLLQIYVVMGAAWSWLRKFEPEAVSGFGRALVLVGANTVMAGAVTVGLAASLQGHHNHHHGGATEAQGSHHATHDAHRRWDAHGS